MNTAEGMNTSPTPNTTRKPMQSWDSDGVNGGPSSIDLLIEWLTQPGNYDRWISEYGPSKESLCLEVCDIMSLNGIHHRNTRDIRNRIKYLFDKFRDAQELLPTPLQPEEEKNDTKEDDIYTTPIDLTNEESAEPTLISSNTQYDGFDTPSISFGDEQEDDFHRGNTEDADSQSEDRAIVPKRRGRKRARYDFEETLIFELEKMNEFDRHCFEVEERKARFDEKLRRMNEKMEKMREERAKMNEETIKIKAQALFVQALKLAGISEEDIKEKLNESWNDDD